MDSSNDKLYNLYVQLEPVIAELEEERKSKLHIILLITSILSILLIIVFVKFLILTNFLIVFALYPFLTLIFWIVFTFQLLYFIFLGEKYRQTFKHNIIDSLVSLFSQNTSKYYPKEFINFTLIKDSLLFKDLNKYKKASLTYQGLDCILYKGNDLINSSNMQCSQLKIGDGDIFKGLFIIIDLLKNTNTAFGTSNNISNNKILLDNAEFNELFPVYAENTTEAFYILPSNLLERMVNFVRKTGRKFDFSVVDNKFYIAIPYNRELLEPPIFKSLFDYSIYEEYLTDLELAIGIVEDLKLA